MDGEKKTNDCVIESKGEPQISAPNLGSGLWGEGAGALEKRGLSTFGADCNSGRKPVFGRGRHTSVPL